MVDECITFLFAATQTTSLMISNLFHYLTREKECVTKIIDEIKSTLGLKSFKDLKCNDW